MSFTKEERARLDAEILRVDPLIRTMVRLHELKPVTDWEIAEVLTYLRAQRNQLDASVRKLPR